MKKIDPKTAKEWSQSGRAILLDVREPNEFSEWRIPMANSTPLTDLDDYLPFLQNELRKIVVYCSDNKRAELAVNAIKSSGCHDEIFVLTDGIKGWSNAGLMVHRDGAASSLGKPIVRQVNVVIGVFITLFSVLSLFGFSYLTYGTLFCGIGLTFAGVTGICGVTMLMQMMPWNRHKPKS